jgi:hypothetical protein
LKNELDTIQKLRFLFGEPRFIRSLDPDGAWEKAFKIENDAIELANQLRQKCIAKECADWIQKKVDIKSVKQANLLTPKCTTLPVTKSKTL